MKLKSKTRLPPKYCNRRFYARRFDENGSLYVLEALCQDLHARLVEDKSLYNRKPTSLCLKIREKAQDMVIVSQKALDCQLWWTAQTTLYL